MSIPIFALLAWIAIGSTSSKKVLRGTASVVALVTAVSWVRGDSSPITTIGEFAQLIDMHVGRSLSDAEAWLQHRRAPLLVAVSAALFVVGSIHASWAVHVADTADEAELGAGGNVKAFLSVCDAHFWALTWLATGLFAQLHALSMLIPILGFRALTDIELRRRMRARERELARQQRAAEWAEARRYHDLGVIDPPANPRRGIVMRAVWSTACAVVWSAYRNVRAAGGVLWVAPASWLVGLINP